MIESETPKAKRKKKQIIYIFFDFETVQNKCLPGETDKFEHTVNLEVAQQVCEACKTNEEIK